MTDQEKDPAAQAMVAKRWAKTTPAQRKQLAKQLNEARWGAAGDKKAGKKKVDAKASKRKV